MFFAACHQSFPAGPWKLIAGELQPPITRLMFLQFHPDHHPSRQINTIWLWEFVFFDVFCRENNRPKCFFHPCESCGFSHSCRLSIDLKSLGLPWWTPQSRIPSGNQILQRTCPTYKWCSGNKHIYKYVQIKVAHIYKWFSGISQLAMCDFRKVRLSPSPFYASIGWVGIARVQRRFFSFREALPRMTPAVIDVALCCFLKTMFVFALVMYYTINSY